MKLLMIKTLKLNRESQRNQPKGLAFHAEAKELQRRKETEKIL